MRNNLKRAILLLNILLFCLIHIFSTASAQQQNVNNEKGLNAESQTNETIDYTNLYNGNLSLAVPLGQTYRVGGSLSYKLTLVYNSSVWDFKYALDRSQNPARDRLQAVPDQKTNAGLGWHLSLGTLYPPRHEKFDQENQEWVYVAPDGSEHRFYDRFLGQTNADGKLYTRDSTYLRLTPGELKIEFPDGLVHWFDATGPLTRIEDRSCSQPGAGFCNFLNVDISNPLAWHLTDSYNREHFIFFNQFGQTDRVELAAFNGSRATYQFHYLTTLIERHQKNKYNFAANDPANVMPSVLLLDEITLPTNPDGNSAGSFAFTYYTSYGGTPSTSVAVPGAIETATLPTLGRYKWTYMNYTFITTSSPGGPVEPKFDERFSSSDGVRSKEIFAPGDSPETWTSIGTWNYGQEQILLFTNTVPAQVRGGYTKTTVRSPEGDETVNYFHNAPSHWDYALPYAREFPNADKTMFLSQEIYKGPARKADGTAGDKRRMIYQRYESDLVSDTLPVSQERDFNRRLAAVRTLFLDDGNNFRTVSYSDFDGLGHYRSTKVSGNFIQNGTERTTTINYNPGGARPAPGSPWILDIYNESTETEGTSTARKTYCFDPATGFMDQERVLVGDLPGDKDVVIQYSKSVNSRGNISTEEYFGGDPGGAGTTACARLSNSQFRIDYTYDFGSVKTKAYANAGGTATVLKLVDRDIDLNTGLTVRERAASGIEDRYEYDNLGRMLWIIPAETQNNRAWKQFEYVVATSGANPEKQIVRQRREDEGKNGAIHTAQINSFDGFGRVAREENLKPNTLGDYSTVVTNYNAMGWKTSVSERMDRTPTRSTLYQNFDPFGRPEKIIPADGPSHEIRISYGGLRGVTRSAKIGLTQTNGVVSEDWVETSEVRDVHGRLVKVIENSSQPDNDIVTEYSYDVGNRLASAKVTSRDEAKAQLRTFSYDNRGFMLSETHPENGTTFYSDYDARGHARRKRTGAIAGPFDLVMSLDRSERVRRISQAANSAGDVLRHLKEFTYAAGPSSGAWSTSKLVTAIRHNYHVRPNAQGVLTTTDVVVTENYKYDGIGGGVSQRDTSVNTGDGIIKSYSQSWTYTNLGQVETLTYPQCQHTECKGTAGNTPYTVSFGYSRGRLVLVNGKVDNNTQQQYVSFTAYHPNGLIDKMTFANGLAWTQSNDPNAIARPSRIFTSGVITNARGEGNFDTGQYQYDGGKNTKNIGTNYFVYDRFNRLIEGTQFARERWRQTYDYDDFGNMIGVTTFDPNNQASTAINLTSTATNRLAIGASYDESGNQTTSGNNQYAYDSLNMARQFQEVVNGATTQDWIYSYTADEQRIWSYNFSSNQSFWRIRDLDGKVLREYSSSGSSTGVSWRVLNNYIYHGNRLIASFNSPGNIRLFFTDHLGTPRLVVNQQTKVADESHHYLPFGLERPFPAFNADSLKFTGHERDLNGNSETDDLDYMHARYYNMRAAKFLSIDPKARYEPLKGSQLWNRYAYVINLLRDKRVKG